MNVYHVFFFPLFFFRCVSALHLDTLNKQRTMLLVQSFIKGKHEQMQLEWVSSKVMRVFVCLFVCFFVSTHTPAPAISARQHGVFVLLHDGEGALKTATVGRFREACS